MTSSQSFKNDKKIRAVVIDIDGTLTDAQRQINLEAVQKIRELPIPTILVSGNVICFVKAASKLMGTSDIMIGENGGVILNGFDSDPIVLADVSICRSAYQSLSKDFPELEISDSSDRFSEIAFRRNMEVEPLKKFLSIYYPQLEIIDTGFAMHLKHRSVNKGTGLINVASIMGLKPENFAAIGDAVNDIPMLEAAGYGIAVCNAHPELKKIASLVTQKSFGDGCSEGLDQLTKIIRHQ
jgi:phosphoglycolate phosphatase